MDTGNESDQIMSLPPIPTEKQMAEAALAINADPHIDKLLREMKERGLMGAATRMCIVLAATSPTESLTDVIHEALLAAFTVGLATGRQQVMDEFVNQQK